MSIVESILKPKNETLIVSPDENKKKESYDKVLKYLSYDSMVQTQNDNDSCIVYFENGSTIQCVTPQPKFESDCIRGQRAKINHWYFDYEIPEDIDEILKPFEKEGKTK